MKKYLYRLGCLLLLIAAVVSKGYAANGIIQEYTYQICPGDTVRVNARDVAVYSDTILYDTIPVTDPNRDSIYAYMVHVYPTFMHKETKRILTGRDEPFVWHDTTITTAGTYERVYTSVHGCDSIYRVKVEEFHVDTIDTIAIICPDTTITWYGKTYGQAGTYEYPATRANGDPIQCRLHLTVAPSYHFTEQITFHDFPATYRGYTFTEKGSHDFRFTSSLGCDSIITVYANQGVTRTEDTEVICKGQTFIWKWDGRTYSESGDYVKTIKDASGKDSVEHILHLTVTNIPDTYVTENICKGGSIAFGDTILRTSGHYTYTFHTPCDSVVHLTLNVLSADTNRYARQMNEGDSCVWHGETYHGGGTFYQYGTNRFGCDSVSILTITINHVDTIDTIASICPGETLHWHGIHASQNGTFYGTEEQADGSFNFYRLHLTVREIKTGHEYFTICGDGSVEFNGKTFRDGGEFTEYVACDSVVILHITKHPQAVFETKASLGGSHGYTWTYWDNGSEQTKTFLQAGTYEYESPNAETGCSELWRLVLSENNESYHFEESMTICEGDDFSWHGRGNLSHQYVGQTHDYTAVYYTRTGQDSIYTLHLTVKPIKRTYRTIAFCGETTYKGRIITSDTQMTDTVTSSTGCDSIITIHFDKAQSYFFKEHKDLPQGQIYRWHDQDIVTNGTYHANYYTIYGCDSIYELTVKIIPASPQTNQYAEERSICAGDSTFWRGQYRFSGGTYVDTVWKPGVETVDSIFTLKLTVYPSYKTPIVRHLFNCNDEGYIYYLGEIYTKDTVITNTFSTVNGCDSIEKVYMHFGQRTEVYDTVRVAEDKLPYVWSLPDTTIYLRTPGTHTHQQKTAGACMNTWELYLEIYNVFHFEDSVAICESELPYYWTNGPIEHRNVPLSGEAGKTTLVTYTYRTAQETDSTYQLKMYVLPQVKHIEQIWLCEGESKTLPNGHVYFRLASDSIYRDTVSFPNPNIPGCDSIVYYEIQQHAALTVTETQILHLDSTIEWHGQTITTGGLYEDLHPGVAAGGCDSTYYLNAVEEQRQQVFMCIVDTPYVWTQNDRSYYTSGLWTDTVRDGAGYITEFHTLDLRINVPVDKDTVLRGCLPGGVNWNGINYTSDVTFRDTLLTCDTMYTVKIHVDQTYIHKFRDTICESELPYVIGDRDSIYTEGWSPMFTYTTSCGCDSIVQVNLSILPDFDFDRADSAFFCEEAIKENPIILGDTVHPAFDPYRQKVHEWQGKWVGVKISNDTIVYNCDSTKQMHVIVRPHQEQPRDTTYYLCKGDSVQLFWPKETWVKSDGIYYDTVTTRSAWEDSEHHWIHNDYAYACDSVTRWTVIYADTIHQDTTVHIAKGDSMWWGGSWYYTTGVYDSIAQAPDTNTPGEHCKATYTLHLYVDDTYYFRDTLSVCEFPNKDTLYTWANGYKRVYSLPGKDSSYHEIDTLHTLIYRFDSIYDMYIDYRQKYRRIIRDTVCYGDSVQFDRHSYRMESNITTERYLKKAGIYVDTLIAHNGCDSIIELRLEVRNRIDTMILPAVSVVDRTLPYLWKHNWTTREGAQSRTDTLFESGIYRDTLSSYFGCDSVVVLPFTVRPTYLYRDTIDTCAAVNKTLTYIWSETGHKQAYTTPTTEQTLTYKDTVIKNNPHDSLFYELLVHFHPTYETHVKDTICEGDSVRFDIHRGNSSFEHYLFTTGIYHDTLQTMSGCDSVITMHLQVWPKQPTAHRTIDIADVDTPYIWVHTWMENATLHRDTDSLYTAGEHIRRLQTIHGCDSIDSLTLRIHKTYHIYETEINICEKETPFTWHELNNITTTGDYENRKQTKEGYDSVYYVHINVYKQTYDTVSMNICEGDSVAWGFRNDGVTPRFAKLKGLYNDTLLNAQGCDSIRTLQLNVLTKFYHDSVRHIADVDTPYVWIHRQGGIEIARDSFYASGVYGFRFDSQHHCDSIDSLHLYVHKTYRFTEEITICESETPYTWKDRTGIVESGTFFYNPHTYDGYDSIYTATITVVKTKRGIISEEICTNQLPFNFRGKLLNEGGIYTDSIYAENGCDSIVELHLTVNDPYYQHYRVDIYEDQFPYTFFDKTITKEEGGNTYRHVKTTPNGCDSITEMMLVVHPLIDTTAYVCSYDLPYAWRNHWTGDTTWLYGAGVYHNDTTYDANGERTFWSIDLHVTNSTLDTINATICEGESFPFGSKSYNEAGTYDFRTTGANGCDSITTLVLTVNPLYRTVIKKTIFEGDTVEFEGEKFWLPRTYTFRHPATEDRCDSLVELVLTVNKLYDDSVTVCYSDLPYKWQLKSDPTKYMDIYASGVYRDTLYSEATGDMTVTGIKVHVLPIITDGAVIHKTICEGDIYTFGLTKAGIPRILTKGDTYYDTITSSIGCDSIVKLVLTVQPVVYQTETKTIFEGDSIEFPKGSGEWKKTASVYEHRVPIPGSVCFDTYQLILKVAKPVELDTTAYVCENELPFIWHGVACQEEGDYTLPIEWSDTSHIMMTLHLVVREAPRFERTVELCQGDTFTYKGVQYYEKGDFYDTIPSVAGCDSIIRYIVRVHPTYDKTIIQHTSDKKPYEWHGRILTISGTYEHTDHTKKYGCDSTEHLILTVHPSFFQTDSIDLCKSDTANFPYKWHGLLIENSGTYWDSTLTSYGFDSVYKLIANVHPSYMTEEKYEIGVGEVLKIHGRDISKPAIYYDTLRTIHGCDSVFHVVINQKRTKEFTWDKEICANSAYEFFGRKLTHTGKYTYTSQYKDSIVTLNLKVYPVSTGEKRVLITDKQAESGYIYDGRLYDDLPVDGGKRIFSDTLVNQYGCDSIFRLAIVVTKRYSEWNPIPLCPGSEVKIDGQVITKSGLYTFERRSRVTGEMDSLYRVEVYDAPAYEYDMKRTVCEGDTLFFQDSAIVITRGGHHDIVLKTVEGCDSVFHLDLTVNPAYHYYDIVTVRDFEPYEWFGKTYFESGVYERSYPTIHDCDSTYTLDLRVIPTIRDTLTEAICTGQSYNWRGKLYDIDGYYTDTVWKPEANFSAIYSLRLTIAYPTIITRAQTGDICADAESFDIRFDYDGLKPTHYSVYFGQAARRQGFEDVIDAPFGSDMIAHVPMPQFPNVAYQGHPYYVRPDYYTVRLALDNGVCGINLSDSMTLLVKYPSWILEQNWDDVVAPLKSEYNGGFEFSQIEWWVNGLKQTNTPQGYLHHDGLAVGDQVVMWATRRGESVSIPTCPLTIQTPAAPYYETLVIVYPTQTPKQMPNITVEAPKEGRYDIYSSTGLLLQSGTLDEGKTILTLPAVNGIYFIRTFQGRDAETHKVILY